jgi:hypothetical protein
MRGCCQHCAVIGSAQKRHQHTISIAVDTLVNGARAKVGHRRLCKGCVKEIRIADRVSLKLAGSDLTPLECCDPEKRDLDDGKYRNDDNGNGSVELGRGVSRDLRHCKVRRWRDQVTAEQTSILQCIGTDS